MYRHPMSYTIEVEPGGCYAPGNPSRAETGQRGETLREDTLREALEAVPVFREARILDQWGDAVVEVRVSGRGSEAVAPDGAWGPEPLEDVETILYMLAQQ